MVPYTATLMLRLENLAGRRTERKDLASTLMLRDDSYSGRLRDNHLVVNEVIAPVIEPIDDDILRDGPIIDCF